MGALVVKPKHPQISPCEDEIASEWLARHGFDSFQMILPNGDSVLHSASRLGDLWMCQYIIDKGGSDCLKLVNSNKQTPLMVAVESGHLIVCDALHNYSNSFRSRRCDGEGDLISSVHSKFVLIFVTNGLMVTN